MCGGWKAEALIYKLCDPGGDVRGDQGIVTPEQMEEAVFTDEKQKREENIRQITEKLEEAFSEHEDWLAVLGEAVYQYQKKTVRKMILKDHKRPDGRAMDQVTPACGR